MSNPTRDHLTTLPSEILHQIFTYLFPTHDPNAAIPSLSSPIITSHPLLSLSLLHPILLAETNAWAIHTLKTFPATAADLLNSDRLRRRPKGLATHPRPLAELLRWSRTHCVFCGKKSQRAAMLMSGLKCCAGCDRREWREKVTMTEAKKGCGLGSRELFGSGEGAHRVEEARRVATGHGGLGVRKGESEWEGGEGHVEDGEGEWEMETGVAVGTGWGPDGMVRRGLRFGTSVTLGMLTTVFWRPDVERRAAALHGPNWKEELVSKRAARAAKRRETAEKAQAKREREAADAEDEDDSNVGDEVERPGGSGSVEHA